MMCLQVNSDAEFVLANLDAPKGQTSPLAKQGLASDHDLPGLQSHACKRTYVKAAESDQRLLMSVKNYITKYAPSICLSLSLSNDK